MANTTYIELTNALLSQFNEVEIEPTGWNAAKGVQAKAKRAVNDSLRMIYSYERYWPFTVDTYTETLVAGTSVYDFPADFAVADWQSFQIQGDTNLNVDYRSLRPIDKDEWFQRFRDNDSVATGNGVPYYVFAYPGNKYGVSPNPRDAYDLTYNYYKRFVPLVNSTDETDIPPEFDHVILNGGMVYFNIFLDNNEQANIADNGLFKPSLSRMRSMLINDDLTVRDTRIQF